MEKMDGHFLRKLREERGWSLREFAEKIYTSKSTVQRWEQSSPPGDEETCARIAEAFGMSEEELRARGVHNLLWAYSAAGYGSAGIASLLAELPAIHE